MNAAHRPAARSARVRLLDNPVELAARARMLGAPHARALAAFAAELRRDTGAHVPDIDPLDGGSEARVVLLLETPGPAIRDTGFVSRDNPTPTARNIRRFAAAAGLPRADTVIWNAVPWTIHEAGARNRAPRPGEIRAGLGRLPAFLRLLPRLRCAILAGRVAGLARGLVETVGLDVVAVPHPSPTIVCTDPGVALRIVAGFALAAGTVPELK